MENVDNHSQILEKQHELVDRLAAMATAQREAHAELMEAQQKAHRELMAAFDSLQTRAAEHREVMAAFAEQEKRSATQPCTFQHSHITKQGAGIVRDRLELQCVDVAAATTGSTRTLRGLIPFEWKKSSRGLFQREDDQRGRYHEHTAKVVLNGYLRRALGVFGVEHDGHAINAAFVSNGVYLNGTADMLIAPLGNSGSRVVDARAAIEVKKDAGDAWKTPNAHHQAMSELLALDQHASGVVFSVLTDLRDAWIFFWLEPGRQVASRKLYSLHAGVETLREFLSADCAWIGYPVDIRLTHAAASCVRATKLDGESMQAPLSTPSQHPTPATTGAASAAAAASTTESEPPKTYPLRTPTKRADSKAEY